MAPKGKITSFFKPFQDQVKKQSEEVFDADEIVVLPRQPKPVFKEVLKGQVESQVRPTTPKAQAEQEGAMSGRGLNLGHDATPRKRSPSSSPLTPLLETPLSIRTIRQEPAAQPERISSSFASNASRQMVINGVHIVTDSDSDDLSSDDGLADISALLPRKRLRLTPPSMTLKADTSSRNDSKTPPKKAYKHNLTSLIQQRLDDEAREARVKQAEADVHEASEEQLKQESVAAKLFAESENSDRVMAAISRADVFDQSDVFYFFHGTGSRIPLLVQDFDEDYAAAIKATSTTVPLLREAFFTTFDKTDLVPQLPSSLTSHLELLGSYTATDEGYTKSAIVDLFLATADDNIQRCITTREAIEDCLQRLLARFGPGNYFSAIHEILRGEGQHLLHEGQMAKAIAALPATSVELHGFRRQMALQHLLGSDEQLIDPTSSLTCDRLVSKLQNDSPLLTVSSTTDWKSFCQIVRLLDVAIDAGFSNFDFFTQQVPEAERAFNRQVDTLAKALSLIANSIHDSGASQLRRSEAKAALSSLVQRIEFSVRTAPKKRKSVFGTSGGTALEKKQFENFFTHHHHHLEPQAASV